MNAYEQNQQARKERLEGRAAAAAAQCEANYAAAKKMASAIPFGQPVLVGHHSESRDRRYRASIKNKFEQAAAAAAESERLAQKAASVGTGGISSDDPDAINKLRAQLGELQAAQERMKAANKAIKTNKTEAEKIAALMVLGFDEKAAHGLLKPAYASRPGFQSYALTNNNANIRRVQERICSLEKRSQAADVEINGEFYTYRESDNRVQFIFDGKPAENVRNILKAHAFKWSPSREGQPWVRQLTNAGKYAAQQVISALQKLEG